MQKKLLIITTLFGKKLTYSLVNLKFKDLPLSKSHQKYSKIPGNLVTTLAPPVLLDVLDGVLPARPCFNDGAAIS